MSGTNWGMSPRASVERESSRRGHDALIDGCIALLGGATPTDDPPDSRIDGELIRALGGPPARWATEGGEPGPDYWLRVWAARGLMHVWDDRATPVVIAALKDEQWRVREMAAKVCAKHRIEHAAQTLSDLTHDERARVRQAAERALVRIADS